MNDSSHSQDVHDSSNEGKNIQSEVSCAVTTSGSIPPLPIFTSSQDEHLPSQEPLQKTITDQPTTNQKPLSAVILTSQTRGSTDITNNYVHHKSLLLQVPKRMNIFGSDKNKSLTKTLKDAKRTNRELRVFVTLTYIIIGYLICWVPFHFVFDLTATDPKLVPTIVYDTTFWLTYVNSTINPFLYNFCSPDFRRAFKRIICRTKSTPINNSMGLLAPSV